ncbi:MAG: MmcQ/YjbR family DNA-binding protein [Bacteroidota bacterium]
MFISGHYCRAFSLTPVGKNIRPAVYLDELRDYCLAKTGATEDMPFGPDVLTFKVAGKVFAMTNLERMPLAVALKCDPERTVDLRATYHGVSDGPYLRNLLWNYVQLQADVPVALVRELVDQSYDLVVSGLPKRERQRLAEAARGAS